MIVIREVTARDHIDAIADLIAANWAETGFDFELDLNVDAIARLQDMGFMFALAAFQDEQIIGYSTAMIGPHTFNPGMLFCNSDALFVLPEWRKSSAGARLIIETERVAKQRGAVRMLWHTRAGTPLAEVLKRRGYSPADIIVMKEI